MSEETPTGMVSGLVGRFALGFIVLYVLFWCLWLQYHRDAFDFLLGSKDKKWPKPRTVEEKLAGRTIVKKSSKHLVFIRHGESTWNETFNRNKLFLLPRMIFSAAYEIWLIISGANDSWFYDSPLSNVGRVQAQGVRDMFKSPEKANDADVKVINAATGSSLVVCSNLRRCISTALICVWDRLSRTEEKVVMLPFLQEMTTNPDGLSITAAGHQPKTSWKDKTFGKYGLDMDKAYSKWIDSSGNTGSKDISSNGLERMNKFNKWLFGADSQAASVDTVIIAGHSLWFKSYFATFHPDEGLGKTARRKKMKNCAVVAFTVEELVLDNNQTVYRIDPSTTRSVYLGFKK